MNLHISCEAETCRHNDGHTCRKKQIKVVHGGRAAAYCSDYMNTYAGEEADPPSSALIALGNPPSMGAAAETSFITPAYINPFAAVALSGSAGPGERQKERAACSVHTCTHYSGGMCVLHELHIGSPENTRRQSADCMSYKKRPEMII